MKEIEELKGENENFALKTSTLFAKFRVNFYSSIIKKHLVDLTNKKKNEPTIVQLNSTNVMYVISKGIYLYNIYLRWCSYCKLWIEFYWF